VLITRVVHPASRRGAAGGIDELRAPGLHVTESLRPPVLLEHALRGADLSRSSLSYVLERTTGPAPLRRSPVTGPAQDYAAADAGDGETQLDRELDPPAARTYRADGVASIAPNAPDAALDRLAGTAGPAVFASSGRFEGRPDRRASRAFDGSPATGWIAPWIAGHPAWLSWRAPHPVTVRRLRLVASAQPVRRPALVRLRWGGGTTPPLRVAPDGTVTLPARVRARAFRLDVLAARFPAGTSARGRLVRAVGVAEVRGAGVRAPATPPSRSLRTPCGAMTILAGARSVALRLTGATAALEAGGALRLAGCGRPLALPAGPVRVVTRSALARPLVLRLRSAAPAGSPAPAPAGRVVAPGRFGRSTVDGVRVDVTAPAWLVLAESYDRGWRAWCDGRALGAPQVVDASANGWRVAPGCHDVRFAFAPDAPVRWTMIVSGLAALALLALVLVRRRPRGAGDHAAVAFDAPRADAPARLEWRRALIVAIPAGLALGFCLGARFSPLFALIVALVLRRGVGARPLILAAAGLLAIAVPILYLVFLPHDPGGYQFGYAGDQINGHWAAVLALVALLLALVRTVSARAPGPPAAAAPSARASTDPAAAPASPGRAA
jgi:hypothetical protein